MTIPLNQDAPSRVILADGTYELIKAMILDHRIAPDTRVNIDDLARRLSVSRDSGARGSRSP